VAEAEGDGIENLSKEMCVRAADDIAEMVAAIGPSEGAIEAAREAAELIEAARWRISTAKHEM
jgi:hypothetical protein